MKNDMSTISRSFFLSVFFGGLLFLQTGCGSDQNNNADKEEGFHYENVKVSSTYKGCEAGEDGCTYYTVDYPVYRGFQGADKINSFILHEFLEAESKNDLRYNADEFIALYEKTYSADPEERVPWFRFIQVDGQLLFDTVVQIHMNVNEYTGGAHANYGEYYRNFKLNGEMLDYSYFLKSMTDEVIEEKLMEAYLEKNPEGENLLLEDKITITNNFLPVENGVVFVYNPYDIAPFSAGIIKLRLNYE